MQMKATVESRMRRLINSYHFKTRKECRSTIYYLSRLVEKYGSLSFLEAVDILDAIDFATDRDPVTWAMHDKATKLGWTTLSDWTAVCENPNSVTKTYWRINAGLPKKIEWKYYRYPKLHEGDRVRVVEYGVGDDGNSLPNNLHTIMTWNTVAVVGRHTPDYCEFVAEYPAYVVVRGHFEDNDGESYCDCIPTWALRQGRIVIKTEEDD